jgi:2-dehydro-3-deoxy-D-gluconate 5-dehydrogenase
MGTPTITQLFDLSGKCAVVTGGGSGIGQAAALRLAEAGALIVVTDLDLQRANQTVDLITASKGIAHAVHADARSLVDAKRVFEHAEKAFKSVDILVNNAGIFPMLPLLNVAEEDWDQVLDVNLKGVFFYSQVAAQAMIKSGCGGKIINMSSMAGLHPHKEGVPYISSKAGVVGLTKALALELGQHQIRVNAIAPGNIMTPGIRALRATRLGGATDDNQSVLKGFSERLPLGRRGEPDDVAMAVLFLASSAADYITGTVMVVDGGYLLT